MKDIFFDSCRRRISVRLRCPRRWCKSDSVEGRPNIEPGKTWRWWPNTPKRTIASPSLRSRTRTMMTMGPSTRAEKPPRSHYSFYWVIDSHFRACCTFIQISWVFHIVILVVIPLLLFSPFFEHKYYHIQRIPNFSFKLRHPALVQ